MKRSPMPARRSPLEPGIATLARSPMARGTGLARKPPTARTAPVDAPRVPRPRVRYTGPTQAVKDAVAARDGGVCVACGQPGTTWDPLTVHHRKNRGHGGGRAAWRNQPPNLLTLHASLNGALEASTDPVHYGYGWKVRHDKPGTESVLYADGRRYLLADDGTKTEAKP